jgi:putative nucleotidyltransferase with HDIG domain
MKQTRKTASLLAQKIDRVAFTTYFLGAVAPLVALGVVVDRYALPTLSDRNASLGLIGLVASIALLSMGSFLVLRHVTRRTLSRIDGDNRRLSSLLKVSSRLAAAQHVTEATSMAAGCARELAQARAAFVFVREGDKWALVDTAGDGAEKLYESVRQQLDEVVGLVMEHGRPVLRGAADAGARSQGLQLSAAAAPLPGDAGIMGVLAVVRAKPQDPFSSAEGDALSTLAALAAVALHNSDLRDSQRNFFAHVTDLLVNALDSHLGFNTGHSHRVAQVANRIGRALGLDEHQLQRLHFASLLHDIGMLKLDRNQQMNRRTCEKHCVLGYRMLTHIRLWKDVAPLVQHHPEWWDGNGYPEGLAGEAIPLESRIIGLCEAFDAMTNEHSYRDSLTLEESVAEMVRCSGTQFEPKVVEVFRQLVEEGVIEA